MGYATLAQEHKLQTLPHFCRSYVAKRGHRQTIVEPDQTIEVYSKAYSIGDTLGEQLEFALKYEGVNLEILSELFEKVDPEELVRYIKTKPTDKQARRIWHLYEFLTGKQLALDDLKKFSRYDTLLDEKQYFTGNKKASKRHKIHDNLLGNRLNAQWFAGHSSLSNSLGQNWTNGAKQFCVSFSRISFSGHSIIYTPRKPSPLLRLNKSCPTKAGRLVLWHCSNGRGRIDF